MNDDELRAELERRSQSAPFRAEELLPGVRRVTGVRPRPARFARWAVIVATVVVFAILVAVVIASRWTP
jgi:hypothetical protein